MKKDLLLESKRLYDLGFGIHWLKPKSKIPIRSNWANGERLEWNELKRTYKDDNNIGCQLGKASAIEGGYLAVLDIDIKSDNPDHKNQALQWLNEHFPNLINSTAITISGRGHGSCHIWVKTKTPLPSRKLHTSSDKCIVHMPSVQATPDQIKELGRKKTKEGFRIRPAFEIDFMSTGRQVVLPPSTHPDTHKKYIWKNKIEHSENIVLLKNITSFAPHERVKKDKEYIGDWEPINIVNINKRLDMDTLAIINDGENVSDGSLACLAVSKKLINNKFNDDEILTILTDPKTFIGKVSYKHTNSQSRKKAAQWIKNYILDKAKEHLDPASDFKDVSIDSNEPWKEFLDKTEHGKVRPLLTNIILIIKNVVGIKTFKRNDFSHIDVYGATPPWNDKMIGNQIQDVDITNIISWFAHKWGFEPTELKVNQAIQQIADENKFNPVKEYLEALKWDKKPRVANFLKSYLNANGPKIYLQAISKKFLCAMIARIYEPGIKYDTVLILEGKQGVGKSTASRILGGQWFTDTGIVNIGDKDSYLALQGKWLIELGELSSLRKADLEKLKAYIAAQTDDIRPPYGRRIERFSRQSVFIGTTNADNYLSDPSGNRRFWPVKVLKCENELLKKDRDQLFAEACVLWKSGEKLYLNDDENFLAEKEQNKRMYNDPWLDEFNAYVKYTNENDIFSFNPKEFTLKELSEHPPFANIINDQRDTRRISLVLRTLNYRSRSSNGRNLWELID